MKYFPLVWAAIMRKPARAILTLLSVMIAFTLFGLTIGMNATFTTMAKNARADRVYVGARFGGDMSLAMAAQMAQIPGVSMVAYTNGLNGYHQEKKNKVYAMMADAKLADTLTEWPITRAQWDMLQKNRTGILISRQQATLWHLKPGDDFVIASPQHPRGDGQPWKLRVLDIVGDVGYMSGGYILGNYDYFNKSLPLAKQDKVDQYFVQAGDPTHSADLAQKVDDHFANSTIPTQSITEKAALDVSNVGIDISAVDRDIALAGMFMVLFLTANGIAQSVRERFAEFATLKTIGFSDNGVMALVFLEAAIPCLLGAALGVGLASWITTVLPRLFPPGQGVPIPMMTPSVYLWAIFSASAVALISAVLPAMRLKRMDIATALSGR